MDIEEEQLWLVLQHLTGGKAGQLRRLLSLSHQPSSILEADDVSWRAVGADACLIDARRGWRGTPSTRARQDQQVLRRLGAVLLPLSHPDYPALLAKIPDPPPLITDY